MNRSARYYSTRHRVRIAASVALVTLTAAAAGLAAYGIVWLLIVAAVGVAGIL